MLASFFGDPLVAVHVSFSLAGVVTGLVAAPTLAAGRWRGGWHAAFLATTVATSATGFLFPITALTSALVVSSISLVLLAVALASLRGRAPGRLPGWRYAASATAALYLNLFVLVAQLFQKAPALQALAPTQSEPPFLAAQTVLLLTMLALGLRASRVALRGAA